MSDCRFGVSPVNYPDPDPDLQNFITILQTVLELIFTFLSEFEPRQNLNQSEISFDNLMGYILSINQCVCKLLSQYSTQFKR